MGSTGTAISGVFIVLVFIRLSAGVMSGEPLEYKISTTWDNQTVDGKHVVTLNLSSSPEGLVIDIHSPFYNEKLPSAKPGRFARLFEFEEVVLLFLSSSSLRNLELQFGPGGHYLAYSLYGLRDVQNDSVIIPDYLATISHPDDTWTGRATIPTELFPAGVDSFNAYSIHGNNPRKFMALYPVASNTSHTPNMHDVSNFMPIDLSKLIKIRKSYVKQVHSSGSDSLLLPYSNLMAMGLCAVISHLI